MVSFRKARERDGQQVEGRGRARDQRERTRERRPNKMKRQKAAKQKHGRSNVLQSSFRTMCRFGRFEYSVYLLSPISNTRLFDEQREGPSTLVTGMAVGGSAAHNGEGEAERQLLEGELHDAECTLLGEVQQIESLAQENNNKVCTEATIGYPNLSTAYRVVESYHQFHVVGGRNVPSCYAACGREAPSTAAQQAEQGVSIAVSAELARLTCSKTIFSNPSGAKNLPLHGSTKELEGRV